MKRFSSFLAGVICVISLSTPEKAYAISWDWVPKVWRFENLHNQEDKTDQNRFECTKRNAWGNCIIFSSVSQNLPSTKQKNFYRRVSSYGGTEITH